VQDRLIAGIATLPPGERRALAAALTAIADTLAIGDGAPPMLFEDSHRLVRRVNGHRAPRVRAGRAHRA
jgi:hypothetical protein